MSPAQCNTFQTNNIFPGKVFLRYPSTWSCSANRCQISYVPIIRSFINPYICYIADLHAIWPRSIECNRCLSLWLQNVRIEIPYNILEIVCFPRSSCRWEDHLKIVVDDESIAFEFKAFAVEFCIEVRETKLNPVVRTWLQ